MAMSLQSYLSLGAGGFHRVAYTDWGDDNAAHVVVCVHGLSRNGRDFDFLARALQPTCRVVCPDVVGRGDSAWLDDKSEYSFATYLADAAALIARVTHPPRGSFIGELQRRLGLTASATQKLDWVGTSMGGLVGLLLAAKRNSPIRRLVLNDVGPLIPWQALLRLSGYVTRGTRFASLADAQAHLRETCAPFGLNADAHWQHLFAHSIAQDGDEFVLRYDPALGQLRRTPDPELPIGPSFARGVDLWQSWEAIECPVLVLRGKESDVLTRDVAEQMQRKRNVRVIEFEGVGHAPALMSADQIAVVSDFLLGDSPVDTVEATQAI